MGIELLKGKVIKDIHCRVHRKSANGKYYHYSFTSYLNVDFEKEKPSSLVFEMEDGKFVHMYHEQNCCESVSIEEIHGDLKDLIGSHVLVAEERTQDGPNRKCADEDDYSDPVMYTFYEIATVKGSCTIRWYGTSNGYYSISVSVEEFETLERGNYYD